MNRVAEKDHLIRLMQMTIEEVRPGYAKVSMPLTDPVKNGMGYAHGGAIFSIADIAFGAAANDNSENFVVTLSTNIEFLRPASQGPLVAIAEVVRQGKHIQSYGVNVFDGSGKQVARTMATGYTTDINPEATDGAWDRLAKQPEAQNFATQPQAPVNNWGAAQTPNNNWPSQQPSNNWAPQQSSTTAWGAPQPATNSWEQTSANGWGALNNQQPVNNNIPAGFDVAEFLRGAQFVYERLQASWDRRDLADIALFATPTVMNVLQEQMRNDPTPSRTEIMDVKSSLIKMTTDGLNQRAEVLFDVLMRENQQQYQPERVKEIWHFVRSNNNDSWKLDGIQQTY
ncbi:MAG: hotdog fold thioesterase [Desulfovibrionaceae bacterium]|nr:hotdog fold thioesterase [Desulfovibrionaceae bacterium]